MMRFLNKPKSKPKSNCVEVSHSRALLGMAEETVAAL